MNKTLLVFSVVILIISCFCVLSIESESISVFVHVNENKSDQTKIYNDHPYETDLDEASPTLPSSSILVPPPKTLAGVRLWVQKYLAGPIKRSPHIQFIANLVHLTHACLTRKPFMTEQGCNAFGSSLGHIYEQFTQDKQLTNLISKAKRIVESTMDTAKAKLAQMRQEAEIDFALWPEKATGHWEFDLMIGVVIAIIICCTMSSAVVAPILAAATMFWWVIMALEDYLVEIDFHGF